MRWTPQAGPSARPPNLLAMALYTPSLIRPPRSAVTGPALVVLALATAVLVGCSPRVPGGAVPGGAGPVSKPSAAPARISVEDGKGGVLFVLTPSTQGYSVSGAGGAGLGNVELGTDRALITASKGGSRYRVKRKETGFKLYRDAGKGGADVEIAALKSKEGKFRIKDPKDRELYQGKVKDQKAKVSTPSGAGWVLKAKPDGAEVEDGSGRRLVRMQGLTSAPAAVFCAAPEFDPLQKAVVTAYCARFGP